MSSGCESGFVGKISGVHERGNPSRARIGNTRFAHVRNSLSDTAATGHSGTGVSWHQLDQFNLEDCLLIEVPTFISCEEGCARPSHSRWESGVAPKWKTVWKGKSGRLCDKLFPQSSYTWEDDEGQRHCIGQHVGGELGDPLIEDGELLFAFLDDVYFVCLQHCVRTID